LALEWPHEPFHIPDDIRSAWRTAGARGATSRKAWEARLCQSETHLRDAFEQAMSAEIPAALATALVAFREKLANEKPAVASRKASEMALEIVDQILPTTVGGSADLTGSNFTKTKAAKAVAPGDYSGRFVHYGIREHGMAAAMNGMA